MLWMRLYRAILKAERNQSPPRPIFACFGGVAKEPKDSVKNLQRHPDHVKMIKKRKK
jgi:hypothetical protein